MSLKPVTFVIADKPTDRVVDAPLNKKRYFKISVDEDYAGSMFYENFKQYSGTMFIEGILNEVPALDYSMSYDVHAGAKGVAEFVNKITQGKIGALGGTEILAWAADPKKYVKPILTDQYTQYIAKQPNRLSYTLNWRVYTGVDTLGTSNIKSVISFLGCATAPYTNYNPLGAMAENVSSGASELKKEANNFIDSLMNGGASDKISKITDQAVSAVKNELGVFEYPAKTVLYGIENAFSSDSTRNSNKKKLSDSRSSSYDSNTNARKAIGNIIKELGLNNDSLYNSMSRRSQVTFRLNISCFKNPTILEWYISNWNFTPSMQFKLDENNKPIPIYVDFSASLSTTTIPSSTYLNAAISNSSLK